MINLSLCHKWVKIAYSEQQSMFKGLQYNATYKDYVYYTMQNFKLVKSYFNKLRFKEFLDNIGFIFSVAIDTILLLIVGVVVAFVLSFFAINFTSGLIFILFSFVIIVITSCNILHAYDNIRTRLSHRNKGKY